MKASKHAVANNNWGAHLRENAPSYGTDTAILAVLMDIRAELRGINDTLDCKNTRDIPVQLRGLRRDLKIARVR